MSKVEEKVASWCTKNGFSSIQAKLVAEGVTSLEDLILVDDATLKGWGMKPIQIKKFIVSAKKLETFIVLEQKLDELATLLQSKKVTAQEHLSLKNSLLSQHFGMSESVPNPALNQTAAEAKEWNSAQSPAAQKYFGPVAGKTLAQIMETNPPTDSFGNPVGSQYDLVRDDSMREFQVLIFVAYNKGSFDLSKAQESLKTKGFRFALSTSHDEKTFLDQLPTADVAWIISNDSPPSTKFVQSVVQFHQAGKGLFLWADNAPFTATTNAVLAKIFDPSVKMQGDDEAQKQMTAGLDGTKPGTFKTSHIIYTGIASLWEGVTISYPSNLGPMKPLAAYNDGAGYSGQTYCAVADAECLQNPRAGRIVVDGGFTKLMNEYWSQTAGTARYVVNATAWLLNIESRLEGHWKD